MVPLDEILVNEIACDLMKIDVEGAEIEVLKGLQSQYSKINNLIIEVHTSIVDINYIYK